MVADGTGAKAARTSDVRLYVRLLDNTSFTYLVRSWLHRLLFFTTILHPRRHSGQGAPTHDLLSSRTLSETPWSTSPTTLVSIISPNPAPILTPPTAGSMVWIDPDDQSVWVYDLGDIAWVLASTALVWIMIPGVGFFYSGLLRRKNALSMIWLSMIVLAVVSFQVRVSPARLTPIVLTVFAVVLLGFLASFQ